jgi:hypothetical protein
MSFGGTESRGGVFLGLTRSFAAVMSAKADSVML